MAIVQNPITGVTRKLFATSIFQYYYGKNIMRSKPLVYHDKNSLAQQKVRNYFKQLNFIGSEFKNIIYYNFKKNSLDLSPYNFFMKKNYDNYYLDNLGIKQFDFTKIILSEGTLNNINVVSFSKFDDKTIRLTIDFDNSILIENNLFYFQVVVIAANLNKYTYTSFLQLNENRIYDISTGNFDYNDITNISFYTHYNSYDLGYLKRFSNATNLLIN